MNWFVAHTKPRQEKKLLEFSKRHGLAATLPCCPSAHKYRGKTVVFQKPIFPGYVFLKLSADQRTLARQNDHVANLLVVEDQETFQHQLEDILQAVKLKLEIRLAPAIGVGLKVYIKAGPLRGLEGWVENRYGMSVVLLRLDFINRAAAVKIDADLLTPI